MNGPAKRPPVSAAHKHVAAAREKFCAALKSASDELLAKQKLIHSQLEAEINEANLRHIEDHIGSAYDLACNKATKKHEDGLKSAEKEYKNKKAEAGTEYSESRKVAKNMDDSKDPNEGGR